MRSRMDRYRELDNDTERTSRSRRNQELYPECIKKESVVRQKRRTSA